MTINLFTSIHIVAATLLMVLLLLAIKGLRKYPQTVWNLAFLICALAYYVRFFSHSGSLLYLIANAVEYLAPICFVACVRMNFQDTRRLGNLERAIFPVMISLLVLSTGLQLNGTALPQPFFGRTEVSTTLEPIGTAVLAWLIAIEMLLGIISVFAGFYVGLKDWDADLVLKRRLARRLLLGIGGPIIVSIIILHGLGLFGIVSAQLTQAVIALLVIVTVLLIILFTVNADYEIYVKDTKEPDPFPFSSSVDNNEGADINPETCPEKNPNDSDILAELTINNSVYADDLSLLLKHMEENEPFKEMGLKLEDLAVQLSIPEYRLRQAINKGLGYRNFNAFLNRHRIEMVIAELSGVNSNGSILEISIDSGFKSISSFNKAFKASTGKTPSEFRKTLDS